MTNSLTDQALRLHSQGRLTEAEQLYRQALDINPGDFNALHFLGILALQQGRTDEALARIGAALKIDPANVEATINYGNALKLAGRTDEALACFDRAHQVKPDHGGGPYNRAILLAALNRPQEALESYGKVIALRPDFAEALHERALLLRLLNRREEALQDFNRLLEIKPGFVEGWSNRAVLLEEMGLLDEALTSCDRALTLDPRHVEALNNRGNALAKLRRHEEALRDFELALAIKPRAYAKAWINRGVVLQNMKCFAQAMESFSRALAIDPRNAEALYLRGKLAWLHFRDYDAALNDLEGAAAADPDLPYALGYVLYVKMHGGAWQDRDQDIARLNAAVQAGKPAIEPFIYQALSKSPADLQRCALEYTARNHPARPVMHRAMRKPGKIRLGYVSGEFYEQATAYLAAGLYEHHDKNRFEILAFDNGQSDFSPMRERLEKAFDKFVDISRLSDDAAAARIVAEEIDILVNLNGYFGERRMGIFARKPAPVQVNFLGFPGTLGASYMDYIVADAAVIPANEHRYYTERVVTLPDSYQANDSRRAIAKEAPGRAACGLPDSAFVFCSFNQSYKLAPEIFARWMTILKNVPGSVLWLLEGHPRLAENLRREAEAQGVAAHRIVFAPMIRNDEHLARLRLADLFLDTLPYNAHTTASDALWAGVPLVTCRGTTFPGRVAASLLQAVGLGELVTEDLDAYECLAVTLAVEPERLAACREKLNQSRLSLPLFNTARYCRHLEEAYQIMVESYTKGHVAGAFAVSSSC
ncbi:MAG TPA: tetratricopeptide repeat protein [Rhizomicrobium sp.]|nr:tetratricopeptide repeat protein [Rhizomicrobium sp.]